MLVWVDGREHEFGVGMTLLAVAREMGFDRNGVSVVVDGEILRRRDWGSTPLRDGLWIEVLAALPGG